jgi:hypothetical protein
MMSWIAIHGSATPLSRLGGRGSGCETGKGPVGIEMVKCCMQTWLERKRMGPGEGWLSLVAGSRTKASWRRNPPWMRRSTTADTATGLSSHRGGLALRPWFIAPTLRLTAVLFQPPNSSALDDTIHDQPQDTSYNESPQLRPLQPL